MEKVQEECVRERQTDRQTEEDREGQRDKGRQGETEKQRDRQTDRERKRQTKDREIKTITQWKIWRDIRRAIEKQINREGKMDYRHFQLTSLNDVTG